MASLLEPQSSDPSVWKPRSALLGGVLANRYRITSFIGQGSTGAVFRADDVIVNKPVAVRILVPALAQQALLARIHVRIDRNKEIARQHPGALINLVDITDAGMTLDGEVFVVTDFIDGDHLSTMLGRGGRLPWSRARSLFIRLGQLIQDLHGEGIILGSLQARHCYAVRGKIKQEAIKIVNHALFERVAADLGPAAGPTIARLARYLAPEVACGEPVDVRTDVYSFGIITYELLTGVPPFVDANAMRLVAMHLQRSPRPPSDLASDLPAEVDAAVLRSLAKAPADRFQSMAAFVAALEAVPQNATRVAPTPVVSASAAATEIPPPSHAPASPLAAAATPVAAALPAEPAPALAAATVTLAATAAATTTSAHAPAPDAAAATLAISNGTSPPAAAPIEAVTSPPAATPAEVAALAAPAAPAPPESAPVPTVRSSPAPTSRPSTLVPGGLRLPPPPTLGRPVSAPSFAAPGLLAPAAATVTAPTAATPSPIAATAPAALKDSLAPEPAAVPKDSSIDPAAAAVSKDSSIDPAAAAVPNDSPIATTAGSLPAAAPSAVLPDSSAATASAVPKDSSVTPATAPLAVLPDSTAATAATASTVPKDSPVTETTAPSAVLPDSAAATASEATRPAPTPQVHATLVPGSVEALAVERALPATPAPAPEPRAAASASSAKRPVIRLTDIRSSPRAGDDSASSSGAYLRVALADTAAEPARPKPAAELEPRPKLEPKPEPRPQAAADPRQLPVVSGETLRAAALHQSPANPAHASLSQVSGTTDSLIATLPRRRSAVLIGAGIGLLAAAGIAMLYLVRPAETPRGDVAANESIARKLPLPSEPEPGATTVPADPPGADALPPGKPAELAVVVAPPPETETGTEAETEPEPRPGKKAKAGAKKPRRTREVVPEEPDIFDQVRAHMNQQKAEEEARKAALLNSQAPKEPLSDADKAKETLERARQASSANNLQLCFSLARQSNTLVKSQDALELMGTCACRLKNETSARVAYNALSGDRRDKVASTCSASGITL